MNKKPNPRELSVTGNDAVDRVTINITASENPGARSPLHFDVSDKDGKPVASFSVHRECVRAMAIHLMEHAP